MIYIDPSLTANTFHLYIKEPPKGTFLMVLKNSLLRDELRFKIVDQNTTSMNIFTIYPVSATTAVDYNTAKLYLNNRCGYNDYEIYYSGGTVTTFNMPEEFLISSGLMYIENSTDTNYQPLTGSTTLQYNFNYN
jgi:hypothetical protein